MSDPFAAEGSWYKGNLHTHTTNSDGRITPQETVELYAAAGYDFLAITDHWFLTPPEVLDPHGMALISGAELHGGQGDLGQPVHVVGLGVDEIPDQPGPDSIGDFVSYVAQHSRLCFIAHPSWCTLNTHELFGAEAAIGLEVYNCTCHRGIGRGESMVQWDGLLARGQRLLGLAVDDIHYAYNDAFGGWIWVKAPELSPEAILRAIEDGRFYASCGPKIHAVEMTDSRVHIRCSPCREISVIDPRPGHGSTSHRLERNSGLLTEVALPVAGGCPVIRIECIDENGYRAWSNPIYR